MASVPRQIIPIKMQSKEWYEDQLKNKALNGFSNAPNIWQAISCFLFIIVTAQFVVMST